MKAHFLPPTESRNPEKFTIINNPPASAGLIPITMMKKFTLICILMLFAVAGLFANTPQPVVVHAGKVVVTGSLPTTVDVPVTVNGFLDVASFNLALRFDNSIMQLPAMPPITVLKNVHPALTGFLNVDRPFVNEFRVTWLGTTIPFLADGTKLFDIEFQNYNGGTSLLTWYDNPDGLCEFGEGLTSTNYDDNASNYINGYVTNIATTITSGITVCNTPNYGWITINATGGSGNYIYKIEDGTPITNTTGIFTNLPSGTYEVSIFDAISPTVEILLNPGITLNVPTVNGYLYNVRLATYYCDLNSAISAAADGDVIQFSYLRDYAGFTYNDPTKSLYFENNLSGDINFIGASPALILNGGTLSFNNVNFMASSNDPTIVVNGGKLILRNCIIIESTLFDNTGVLVAGGELDAGLVGDPGKNYFASNGIGRAITQTSGIANAICNYYGGTLYIHVTSKILGTVAFDPWNDATLNNCIYSTFGGPTTFAPQMFVTGTPNTYQIPITVQNFLDIDAISLSLDYEAAKLQCTGYTVGAVAGLSVTPDNTNGNVKIGWFGATPITSLPNNAILGYLNFTFTGGTSLLLWNDNPDTECEYQKALIQGPYFDDPASTWYIDGFITDMAASYTWKNVTCKGSNDAYIHIAATGGSASYQFSIDFGATWTNTTGIFNGLAPNTYSVWVRDANYPVVVIKLSNAQVLAEPAIALTMNVFESHRVRCKGEVNGQATVNAFNGWGGYTYSINGTTWQTSNIFDALIVGFYTLYVKDANDCVISAILEITEPSIALTASGFESKVVKCKGEANGEATLTGFNGWGTYTYSKDGLNFYTSPVITGLPAGTHTLWVKDLGGCTVPVSVTITEPAVALSLTASATKMVTCFGYNNGEITATAVGGWGTYSYSVDGINWQSSNVLTGLTAGTYTVYVKDLQNCIVAAPVTVTITQPGMLTGVISGDNTVCYGVSSTVTVTITGGTQPYAFEITDGTTPVIVSGLNANTYTFTQPYYTNTTWSWTSLTDANLCTSTLSGTATITVNPLPVVTNVTLFTSVDQTTWSNVGGTFAGGYVMCIDPVIPYHYMDINNLSLANVPLYTGSFVQNAFYLNTASVPANFYTYWAGKGVDGVNNTYGFELQMWQIIKGWAPMFYIKYDGSDFKLIDGLQYQLGMTENPLRINGAYPQGNYMFTGTVQDQNLCTSLPFSITMQLNSSPVVTDVTLLQSTDLTTWTSVTGSFTPGFEMCVDELVQYHYLDINTLTSGINPLAVNSYQLNPFYLDVTSVPAGFYAYWAAKGVVIGASGWQGVMWNIINGTAPMLYINFDGTDYTLVDGLQHQIGQGQNPLRISSDYPQGAYKFTGTVIDVNGCSSSPFSINMTLTTMPQPDAGSDFTVCNSVSYQLQAVPTVGTGLWTMTSGPGTAVFADATSATSLVTVDVAGAYTFTWTETNSICSREDEVVITFLKGTNADAYTIASIPSVMAVSGAPVVTKFTYTLPVADINADANIYLDGVLKVTGGTFPAGMKVTEIRRVADITTTYFKVINGDLSGKTQVFFSDLVGAANKLFENTRPLYNWVVTIEDAAGTTATLNLDFSLITYLTKPVDLGVDCYSVLDQKSYTVSYNEAVITTQDDEVCFGDVLNFPVTIAYPVISNVDVNNEVLLDAKLTITAGGPFNLGATLLWGYNAPATIPSATNIDGKTVLYLSDIVGGTPMPLSGHSGTDVWNISISGAGVGVYDIKVEGIAVTTVVTPALTPLQIPGLPGYPANIYPTPAPGDYTTYEYSYAENDLTLTVHPLPTITLTDPNPKVCFGATTVLFPFTATTNNPDFYSIDWNATAEANGFTDVSGVSLTTSPIVVSMTGSAVYGTYTGSLTVYNSITGCVSQVYTITVDVPKQLYAIALQTTPVSCNGGSDGVATVTGYDGWPAYSYLWSDPAAQTTAVASGLAAGLYNVVVTDMLGCTTTAYVTITEPDVLSATIAKTDLTCYQADDGTITVTNPLGGYGTYQYRLDMGGWQSTGQFVNLAPGTYVVEIRDAAHTSCTMILGSLTILEPAPITLSGTFNYYNLNNTPLNNLTVKLYQGSNLKYTFNPTGANGSYLFGNVCPGTYDVVATTIKPIGGINSTDAVQVNSWPLAPVPIEKIRFKAGDVNYTNTLFANDAGLILTHFVTSGNSTFPANGWSFWKTNDMISVNNFTDGTYPQVTIVNTDVVQNFYGLVNGDFNRSFTPGNAKSGSNLVLTNQGSLMVEPGSVLDVPVTVTAATNASALSLILAYPAAKVEIQDVVLSGTNTPVAYQILNGEIRIGWYSVNPLYLQSGDAILTIRVKALTSITIGEQVAFTLVNDPLNELAGSDYQPVDGTILNIGVIEGAVSVAENPSNGLFLGNYPNPFSSETTISYALPAAGMVTLELFDLAGKRVAVLLDNVQSAGAYTVSLDGTELPAGVYSVCLNLTTTDGTMKRTARIIRQK